MEQVEKLAEIAHRAGAHGLVCSPEEAPQLRSLYPRMMLVVPSVRSPGKHTHDQARVGTPASVVEIGGYLVMGRQVLEAIDPVAEVEWVLTEELKISF